jgi:Protein of unknown function (DUF3775)
MERRMLKHLKPDAIEIITVLAERLRSKFPPQYGKMYFTGDVTIDEIMKIPNDITHHALFTFISAMKKGAMAELKALIWMGRGSDPDFQLALKRARATSGPGDVNYVLDKGSELPEYLLRGATLVGMQE